MKILNILFLIVPLLSIIQNSAMDAPVEKGGSDIVYVKTSDGITRAIARWKIDQIKVLLVLLEHQKEVNSRNNPIHADMIKSEELDMLCNALDAISEGRFKNFYGRLVAEDGDQLNEGQMELSLGQGKRRELVNVAERMQATGVSAFCLSDVMPLDVQKSLIVSDYIDSVIKIMSRSYRVVFDNYHIFSSVAFSPDGMKIVSGGSDLTLCDISKPAGITHQMLSKRGFKSVAFSPDGMKIISMSAYKGNSLILWDISKPASITHQVLSENNEGFSSVAFSPDGTKILSCGDDDENNLILWDISKPASITHQILGEHGGENVSSVAFSSDGTKIVSVGKENNLILWDISKPASITHQILGEHKKGFSSVAFSPDGTKIVSGGDIGDGILILWDISKPANITHQILGEHGGHVSYVVFSPDGTKIVSRGRGSVSLLDISKPERASYLDVKNVVNSVAFSPDGSKIISGGGGMGIDGRHKSSLILSDISDPKNISHQILGGHSKAIYSVAFSSDGTKIVSGGLGNLVLHELLSPEEKKALENCTSAQAQFLYQLCLTSTRKFSIELKSPYAIGVFDTLSPLIQKKLQRIFNLSIIPMPDTQQRPKGHKGDCVIF